MIELFELIPSLLEQAGLITKYASLLGLAINSIIVIFIAYFLRIISRTILLKITEHIASSTKFKFDDFLVKNHFFRNTARIVPLFFLNEIYYCRNYR